MGEAGGLYSELGGPLIPGAHVDWFSQRCDGLPPRRIVTLPITQRVCGIC
jgi:hypothetical protein